MVQILRPQAKTQNPTVAQRLSQGVGQGLSMASQMMEEHQRAKQQAQADMSIAEKYGVDLRGASPEDRKILLQQALQGKNQRELEEQKQLGKENLYNKKQSFVSDLFGEREQQQSQENQQQDNEGYPVNNVSFEDNEQPKQNNSKQPSKPKKYSNEQIAQAAVVDPNLAVQMRHSNDTLTRQEEQERKNTREERTFETSYSRKAVEEADNLRTALPKLEASLDFARNAVESGEVGALSLANIGERLNIPELQTAKGAQLLTAAKENLLGTISRVSARSQNKWFEQRVNSMMAQIGRTKEANLSAQELLEAEVASSKVYLNEFDRLAEQDNENYGFERKDIKKRAHNAAKAQEDHIFKRSMYRLQELDENEKGLSSMRDRVGKNVTKGQPLTLAMAKLYRDKFGKENALHMAEKNGYLVPSLEEFSAYQQQPREFREGL